MGAPCSSPHVLHVGAQERPQPRAMGCTLSVGGSRLSSTHPAPQQPVWDKEGLKINYCKYLCFLHIEPTPESPRPPGRQGTDSSFRGVGLEAGLPTCSPVSGGSVSQLV